MTIEGGIGGLSFYVLGPLEVIGRDGPVFIRGVRRRALLGTLLLHADRALQIPELATALWDEQAPRSATQNIRTYVSELRSVLRRAGSRARLDSLPGAYRLCVAAEELDVQRFDVLEATGKEALRLGDYRLAAKHFGEAMDLWRGEPLSGLEVSGPVALTTAALEERQRMVVSFWIDARLALGEYQELIPVLRELTYRQPYDEHVWRGFLIALHAVGRTADALMAFTDVRHILIDELGIEPGEELQRVHTAILSGAAAHARPLQPAAHAESTR